MSKNYGYVTCVTTPQYVLGAAVLMSSLKASGCFYPFTVLIPLNEYHDDIVKELTKYSLNYLEVEFYAPFKKEDYQSRGLLNRYYSFIKIEASRLVNYDKIILFDTDIFVAKNVDHLFKCESMSSVISGNARHPNWNDLCPGLIVIEPSYFLYNALMETTQLIVKERKDKHEDFLVGDFDIWAAYDGYSWRKRDSLHLDEVYQCLDSDIDYLIRKRHLCKNDIYVIHFASNPKIWIRSRKDNIRHFIKSILRLRFFELFYAKNYLSCLKELKKSVVHQ